MMIMIKQILALSILWLSFQSYGQRNVVGRVLDKDTKKPISGASVQVDQTNTATLSNALGYFQILADSSSRIIVSHPDYETSFVLTSQDRIQLSLTKVKRLPDSLKNVVFQEVDRKAVFKEGKDAMFKLISTNLEFPKNLRNSGLSGEVRVKLLISETGSVDSIAIAESNHDLYSLEAYRVVKMLQKFEPAQKYGIEVRSWIEFPVRFKINGFDGTTKVPDALLAVDYFNTALRFVKSNLINDAIMILGRAIELKENYTDAFYNRAGLYLAIGNKVRACQDWNKAVQLGDKQSMEYIKQYCGQ